MGITGLHEQLRPYYRNADYQGIRRIGIDGYAILHRGVFTCAVELATKHHPWEARNLPPPYVTFFLSHMRALRALNMEPVVVFDGADLPAKAQEKASRAALRARALEEGHRYAAAKQHDKARAAYGRAASITLHMQQQVQVALKQQGIEFIVAPYEADPQLAHLCRINYIQAVLSEDSDMVVYGCPRCIFKWQRDTGTGQQIVLQDLFMNRIHIPHDVTDASDVLTLMDKAMMFGGFSQDMLQLLAVLSGCDFLDNLKHLGIKTAYKHVKEHKTVDAVCLALRSVKKAPFHPIPDDYETRVKNALLAFRHAIVYDPLLQKLVHLEALPDGVKCSDLPFLGAWIEPHDLVTDIAHGRREPHAPYNVVAVNNHNHPPRRVTSPARKKNGHGHGHYASNPSLSRPAVTVKSLFAASSIQISKAVTAVDPLPIITKQQASSPTKPSSPPKRATPTTSPNRFARRRTSLNPPPTNPPTDVATTTIPSPPLTSGRKRAMGLASSAPTTILVHEEEEEEEVLVVGAVKAPKMASQPTLSSFFHNKRKM